MIFENIKQVEITEGVVGRIMTDAAVLWQKKQGYTNLISAATTTPGGTEIYNGTGYKDGYRWSSSSKTETEYSSGRISGWIPYVSGATYRIKNFYMSKTSGYVNGCYLIIYSKNGTISSRTTGRDNENYDVATDTLVWQEENTSCQYFRISAYTCSEAPIITMNEEIPE